MESEEIRTSRHIGIDVPNLEGPVNLNAEVLEGFEVHSNTTE